MISTLLLLLAAAPDAVAERPCEYCAAIFDDVRLNAMIGNGNVEVSSEWAMGRDREDVAIKVEDLNCIQEVRQAKCRFTLRRLLTRNGVAASDPALPETLQCTAMLKRVDEGWVVRHSPPPRIGHSATSMKCTRIEPDA